MDEQPAELLLPAPPASPSGGKPSNKLPFFLGGLLLFLFAGLAFAYFSPKTRVIFQKRAEHEGKLVCMPIDNSGNFTNDKYRYNRIQVINKTTAPVVVWVQENECDYTGTDPSEGYQCTTYKRRYNDTIPVGEQKNYSINPECSKIGQLDVAQDDEAMGTFVPDCFNTVDNQSWQGGIAFTVYANKSPCVTPTITPPAQTPTPTRTPPTGVTNTPIPTPGPVYPSCDNFDIQYDRVQKGFFNALYWKRGPNTGLAAVFIRKKNNDNSWGAWQHLQTSLSDGWSLYTAPNEVGIYEIGVNVYDAGCDDKLMCVREASPAGWITKLYKVTSCSTTGANTIDNSVTALVNKCTNTCRGTFEVSEAVPSPTPSATPPPGATSTPTPTITITPTLPAGASCVTLEAFKIGDDGLVEELVDLKVGDVIRFIITASGTPEKAAVRVKRNGEIIFTRLAEKIPLSNKWKLDYTLTSGGNFEAIGYIKTGGVWK